MASHLTPQRHTAAGRSSEAEVRTAEAAAEAAVRSMPMSRGSEGGSSPASAATAETGTATLQPAAGGGSAAVSGAGGGGGSRQYNGSLHPPRVLGPSWSPGGGGNQPPSVATAVATVISSSNVKGRSRSSSGPSPRAVVSGSLRGLAGGGSVGGRVQQRGGGGPAAADRPPSRAGSPGLGSEGGRRTGSPFHGKGGGMAADGGSRGSTGAAAVGTMSGLRASSSPMASAVASSGPYVVGSGGSEYTTDLERFILQVWVGHGHYFVILSLLWQPCGICNPIAFRIVP